MTSNSTTNYNSTSTSSTRIVENNDKEIKMTSTNSSNVGTTVARRKSTTKKTTSSGIIGGKGSKVMKKKQTSMKQPKDKDKPKRALSAYNIFFKLTRSRIIAGLQDHGTAEETIDAVREIVANSTKRKPPNSRKHRNTHNQITFGDLARRIADAWRAIDLDRKKIYEHYANLDMERYRRDIKTWKETKEKGSLIALSSDLSSRNDPPNSPNSSIRSTSSHSDSSEVSFETADAIEPTPIADGYIIEQKRIELPADQKPNQQQPGDNNFDNQFLTFIEKSSSRQQYAATSYSTNNDREQFSNRQRVIKFDANEDDQELFTKYRLFEESNHSLKQGLLATHILEPNPFFGSDSQLQHQAQQDQKRLFGRVFSDGSNIYRMQQLHRRRELTNNPSFSVGNNMHHLNGLDERIEKSAAMENNFHASHHGEFNYQNDYMPPLKLEGGIESPVVRRKKSPVNHDSIQSIRGGSMPLTGPVDGSDSNTNYYQVTSPAIEKSTLMPEKNDIFYHQINNTLLQSIEIDMRLEKLLPQKIDGMDLDEEIQCLTIDDDKYVSQHDLVDAYQSPGEDFWSEGCKNLK
jgi:hypothetical protein